MAGAKSLSNDQGPRKSPWGKRRVISRRPFQEHFSEYRQTVKLIASEYVNAAVKKQRATLTIERYPAG
jgi:hypothetical protein